jgi:hypothetical protein
MVPVVQQQNQLAGQCQTPRPLSTVPHRLFACMPNGTRLLQLHMYRDAALWPVMLWSHQLQLVMVSVVSLTHFADSLALVPSTSTRTHWHARLPPPHPTHARTCCMQTVLHQKCTLWHANAHACQLLLVSRTWLIMSRLALNRCVSQFTHAQLRTQVLPTVTYNGLARGRA